MTDTDAGAATGTNTPAVIVAGTLTAILLGGMGFAAIHIPGALSSPGASAPAGPPNAGYTQPAPAPADPTAESPASEDATSQGEDDDDQEGTAEEETENDSVSESDDHPDRDSDRAEDTWLRDSEAAVLDADTVYQITEGDTLASISDAVGISVDMLASYNDIENVNVIYERSSLVIPYSEVNIPVDFAEN